MMSKASIFFLICSVIFFQAVTAQDSNSMVGQKYAFGKFSSPGTQPMGPDGRPMNLMIQERVIYFELKNNQKPEITELCSGKYQFSSTLTAVEASSVIAGVDVETGKTITIQKQNGYNLWKLEISPMDEAQKVPATALGNYTIKARLDGKPITIKIKKEITLTPEMRY